MYRNIIITLLLCCAAVACRAQESDFSKESYSRSGITLPYRKAVVNGDGGEGNMLVIYLHGGSSKGDDNEKQIQEAAVPTIYSYLKEKGKNAVMVVPQCPSDKSWIGSMLGVLRYFIVSCADNYGVDNSRIFIMGGSMGGTGTWNMTANYPGLFAAAMPVAGNPKGLDAQKAALTPVYTVMGTADRIMSIPTVESFLQEMEAFGAEYRFDTEEGWSHEYTCEKSYTDERLDWLFAHTRESSTAIAAAVGNEPRTVAVNWFTADGKRLAHEPEENGFYIKATVFGDGSHLAEKYCKRQ